MLLIFPANATSTSRNKMNETARQRAVQRLDITPRIHGTPNSQPWMTSKVNWSPAAWAREKTDDEGAVDINISN